MPMVALATELARLFAKAPPESLTILTPTDNQRYLIGSRGVPRKLLMLRVLRMPIFCLRIFALRIAAISELHSMNASSSSSLIRSNSLGPPTVSLCLLYETCWARRMHDNDCAVRSDPHLTLSQM